jgi:predicted AlkP superfamily phosphohydrolase/phosphomutase
MASVLNFTKIRNGLRLPCGKWRKAVYMLMESVVCFPMLPTHTTMLTGALPARHGIYYNSPFSKEGETSKWYWETSMIKVPTIWDAARKAGLRTASIHWPVSLGAPVDYNIPKVWSTDKNVE